jgi:hypothetical protein
MNGELRLGKPVCVTGEVAEWSIAAVLKTALGESPTGVRIPPSPPVFARSEAENENGGAVARRRTEMVISAVCSELRPGKPVNTKICEQLD